PRWRNSMWPWIKRWLDLKMHDIWPLNRIGPRPQAMYFKYEKAGLTVEDQPIPWNAEAVLVEAHVRLPRNNTRRKADFQLRVPGQDLVAVEHMHPEADDQQCLRFRFAPPGQTVVAELICRDKLLGQLTLPFLSKNEFLHNLRLQMPTLCVRLGTQTVACQTFVSNQCRGLLASAVLTSPTSLVPMLDLELQVEFRCERSGSASRVGVQLCSSQLSGRQALVTVVPKRYPRRIGAWVATWLLGDRPLGEPKRINGISQRRFQRSLRISDTRFVIQATPETVRLTRQVPAVETAKRIGPCFLVSSGEPGMAGQCHLQITAQIPGAINPPLLLEQDVLITDGPTMVAPGTLDADDLQQVSGFELSIGRQSLGVLSLCPAPTAAFNAEGGFKTFHDYTWSAAAEEEMNERLNRLLEGRGKVE
ncbi:MAG: hypothetical protein ACRELF_22805, partial [Gemmataceae bacterium]